jgi:ankyrin repeat protein
MNLETMFQLIEGGEMDKVIQEIEETPDLVHAHNMDESRWDEVSPTHAAAKYGHLDLVKFLVNRGAEVYSNPMRSTATAVSCCIGPPNTSPRR